MRRLAWWVLLGGVVAASCNVGSEAGAVLLGALFVVLVVGGPRGAVSAWCRVLSWLMDRSSAGWWLRAVEWLAVHTSPG